MGFKRIKKRKKHKDLVIKIDYENTSFKNMEPMDLFDTIMKQNIWLPIPKGVMCGEKKIDIIYVFNDDVPRAKINVYKSIVTSANKLLKDYGVNPKRPRLETNKPPVDMRDKYQQGIF